MAKERSPNYPYIGLSVALQGIKQLYDKERRSAVTSEAIAKALGHGTLSGPATSKVAAVRQYGLLDTVSPGKYRVSEAAMALILKKPGDPEYDAVIRKVALVPQLFAELYQAYPEASEDTLRYHLIKERKFSEEGAARVIKSFRDTISVAKLSGASYNNGDGETSDATGEPGDEAPADRFGRGREGRRQAAIDQNAEKAGTVAYSWPLGGGTDVQLVFSGEPTQKNIDILLAQLTIVREIMPTEVAPPPPPTPLTSTPLTE